MTTSLISTDKAVPPASDARTKDKKWINFTPAKKGIEKTLKKNIIPDLDIASLILYEDNHLLVLNKPPVVLTQGDVTGSSNLLDRAKEHLVLRNKKVGEAYLGISSFYFA